MCRVREATPTSPNSLFRAFFVASNRDPSMWYRIDFDPEGKPLLSCSCPHGRRIAQVFGDAEPASNPRACRHMVIVAERLSTSVAETAPASSSFSVGAVRAEATS